MKKRILVTGAGGFIGSHLARKLYDEGNYVRVVDVKWDGYFEDAGIPYFNQQMTADLRLKRNCEFVVRGMDEVYHLAADMGGVGYFHTVIAEPMLNNMLMDFNMLKAAYDAGIERFLFTSSACAYPTYYQENNADFLSLAEWMIEKPAAPDLEYGWEKLTMEKLMNAYHRELNFNTRIARLHNIYGPYGTYDGGREKAPAALCRKVALAPNPGEIVIWGDGNQMRSFCFINDCVAGLMALMKSDYTEGLNIGTDEMVTINQLADLAIVASNKTITKRYDPTKPVGVYGRNADLTKVKEILGWSPQWNLQMGIEQTYAWIEKQVQRKRVG